MLINTYLDTEDFVHLYYPEDEQPATPQGCGAGARMHTKYARPPSPHYDKIATSEMMSERDRTRAPPPPEPPPHRVRAADLYPKIRTHYDEPGLDAPFTPICAEFVQYVGRTADNGILAMSNYRVHVQPRRRTGSGLSMPLRMLDAVEVRDLVHLVLLCKDGKTIKCTFNTGEQCLEWWRRLNNAIAPISSIQETFAAAYAAWAREQPPASVHRALLRPAGADKPHWFGSELERLGFCTKGAWRVSTSNAEYKLCPSYPPLLVVPSCFDDDDLEAVARFRAMRRIPAVVWRHRGNGAVLARSSQPEVGWLGWRSSEDERLLAAFVSACSLDRGLQPPHTSKNTKLLIVDARSYASAVTNRARGGGVECQQYYPHAEIQFMSLPNIHHVRRSFQQLRELLAQPPDQANWLGALERTLWPGYLAGVGQAAALAARALLAGRPVLVHCSDGWDRTPQLAAAAALLLDPYYRTLEGFRVLVTREWLEFGHKFASRCGHARGAPEPNERSPVFLQWLDLVHQMTLQHPTSFEFSQAYLIKLVTHVHSCMFGTFLCNGPKERQENRVSETTADVWRLLEGPAYRNHLYEPPTGEQVLWTDFNVRALVPWWALLGPRPEPDDELDAVPAPPPLPLNGVTMTKTRSCDNLAGEERRPAPRRSSDPNIAADLLKLSSILPRSSSSSSLGRSPPAGPSGPPGALSGPPGPPGAPPPALMLDSVVDSLTRNTTQDHVDGLHPNHFEQRGPSTSPSSSPPSPSPSRGLASNSSSLERELVSAPPAPPPPPSYQDITQIREAARESARQRHISITWRSVSESSQHTDSSSEISMRLVDTALNESSVNHNADEVDLENHNLLDAPCPGPATLPVDDVTTLSANHVPRPSQLTNQEAPSPPPTNHSNGLVVNGTNGEMDHITAEILRVELGVSGSGSGSGSSSEGERRAGPAGRRRRAPRRQPSQLTLAPDRRCRHAYSGDAGACPCRGRQGALCVCGGGGGGAVGGLVGNVGGLVGVSGGRDPPDGLPAAADPLQARLHQIILQQRMVVEELSSQLREARSALAARVTSPAPRRAAPASPPPLQPQPLEPPSPSPASAATSSCSNSSCSGGSGGSCSEVEVGVEARWLPDSAAPRCQHCRHHFWLARRRHHCRRCGGIFCSSCSELSSGGEWPSVRLCRPCRAHR